MYFLQVVRVGKYGQLTEPYESLPDQVGQEDQEFFFEDGACAIYELNNKENP